MYYFHNLGWTNKIPEVGTLSPVLTFIIKKAALKKLSKYLANEQKKQQFSKQIVEGT